MGTPSVHAYLRHLLATERSGVLMVPTYGQRLPSISWFFLLGGRSDERRVYSAAQQATSANGCFKPSIFVKTVFMNLFYENG